MLRVVEGTSTSDSADCLNLSEANVKVRLHRARAILQASIDGPRAERPVSRETARDRAQLLHHVYSATLHVMHDRYFHDERAIVPARALEDVFEEMSKQSQVQARWISVNTRPMSIQHEPKTDFEKDAAKAIGAGRESFEQTKDGYYYRAAPIPLGGGCVSRHTGFFAGPPKSPRFAALVLRIKVQDD